LITLETLANVINLESLKRENIQSTFPETTEYLEKVKGVMDEVSPIVLAIFGFFISAFLIALITVLVKKNEKVHGMFLKIKKKIFWNGILKGV
jgi:hypothetical protein